MFFNIQPALSIRAIGRRVKVLYTKQSQSYTIKQEDSDSEVIICFGTKFKFSIDPIQLLKVITVLAFTLRHSHKLFMTK